jgi:hypothetical protein
VGLSFPFLLVSIYVCFLPRGLRKVFLVRLGTLILGGTGLLEGDGDRLAAAPYLAAPPGWSALEFAMLELVHDAAGGLPLTWCWACEFLRSAGIMQRFPYRSLFPLKAE